MARAGQASAGSSDGRLRGKIAIVTGAARGIGRAVAVGFACEGATVIGLDAAERVSPIQRYAVASPEDLSETERLVRAAGAGWHGVVADIRNRRRLHAVVSRVIEEHGRIDILAAVAGIQSFEALADMRDQDWDDLIDINLTGTANTLRAVIPAMQRQRSGRIIITSSTQGRHGMRDGSAYSASKWGLFGLAKSAALELGPFGITVNVVVPGLVNTALTRNQSRYKQALLESKGEIPRGELEPQVIEQRLRSTPLGVPWVEPEDVAGAYVFLASDEARMVTGATIDVSAGDSAHNMG